MQQTVTVEVALLGRPALISRVKQDEQQNLSKPFSPTGSPRAQTASAFDGIMIQ